MIMYAYIHTQVNIRTHARINIYTHFTYVPLLQVQPEGKTYITGLHLTDYEFQ